MMKMLSKIVRKSSLTDNSFLYKVARNSIVFIDPKSIDYLDYLGVVTDNGWHTFDYYREDNYVYLFLKDGNILTKKR